MELKAVEQKEDCNFLVNELHIVTLTEGKINTPKDTDGYISG